MQRRQGMKLPDYNTAHLYANVLSFFLNLILKIC